ncbi:MAG TPA: FAD-binding oxidoreductase [Dermatophilaceae bacterium]|nr:FAD-binding oxidoreductase [Dermatophilaceae bacterium]
MGDVILEDLCSATEGHAATATESDAVDRIPACWVAWPDSTEQAAAVMRVAAANDLAVVVRGSGTKLTWGARPERVDLVLDMTRMDALVEHAAGDLIVVVGAGRRLDDLQADLAGSGQWLGVDPARGGTVGGLIATAATGPTRLLHGPVRDLLIGVTFVRADGVVAHAGGKVVKNVAGYDVGKLLTGSFGTLGVITQAAFRLHPLPQARRWVSVPVTHLDGSGLPRDIPALVQQLVHSQLVPTAIELDRPASGGATLCLLLEGIPPGVGSRTAEALDLMGAGATADDDAPGWWGAEPVVDGGVLVKLTHQIAGLAHLLTALDDVCAATGLTAHLRGSVGVGAVSVGLAGVADARALARWVAGMRERAPSFGGTVVVLEAPGVLKADLDVWGPVGGLPLMRAVKGQFDPENRLAPGRFVGGI